MDQTSVYQIRVAGRLSESWQDYFDEMEIAYTTSDEGKEITIFTGKLADQAALQGTIQKLYALGLPLVSVQKMHDCTVNSSSDDEGK
jgi:hypothetical protein